ncbi:MAG: phosphate acyltransferase [Gemmatimonadaceae bacterium]
MRSRAGILNRRIVFPEAGDERIVEAARYLLVNGVARPLLVVGSGIPEADVESLAASGLDTIIADHGSPIEFADRLVASGECDACVAGAVYTTAEVLRAALRTIGVAPGLTTVSSAFYMVRNSPWEAAADVLTFTDCAVVRYPTASQLADIAVAAAGDRKRIVGDEPRIAMLSFSTARSGAGTSVNLVREAVALVRSRRPDLLVDGELQGDAALVPQVAVRKALGSVVEGNANVLVFPTLDAGNIAYKLVQRLAGASAIGPVLQGLARPAADLSRGATADDIINVAAIAALQSELPSVMHTLGEKHELRNR